MRRAPLGLLGRRFLGLSNPKPMTPRSVAAPLSTTALAKIPANSLVLTVEKKMRKLAVPPSYLAGSFGSVPPA